VTTDWSTLSTAQLRCIDALDFAPPLHETHLAKRHKVRGPTVTSLIAMGLIRREYLHDRDHPATLSMPFLRLTQLGLAYQRDWRQWRDRVSRDVAGICGTNAADVAATLDRGIGR
jgi:DNA-binding MarR family transcriptional regulator